MPNWNDTITLSTGRVVTYRAEAGCLAVDTVMSLSHDPGRWRVWSSPGADWPSHTAPLLPSPDQLSADRDGRVREVWELLATLPDVDVVKSGIHRSVEIAVHELVSAYISTSLEDVNPDRWSAIGVGVHAEVAPPRPVMRAVNIAEALQAWLALAQPAEEAQHV